MKGTKDQLERESYLAHKWTWLHGQSPRGKCVLVQSEAMSAFQNIKLSLKIVLYFFHLLTDASFIYPKHKPQPSSI